MPGADHAGLFGERGGQALLPDLLQFVDGERATYDVGPEPHEMSRPSN